MIDMIFQQLLEFFKNLKLKSLLKLVHVVLLVSKNSLVHAFFAHCISNCIILLLTTLVKFSCLYFSEENTCEPNPCQHDGICTELKSGGFECTCKKGHFGDKCQGR